MKLKYNPIKKIVELIILFIMIIFFIVWGFIYWLVNNNTFLNTYVTIYNKYWGDIVE
jgi:hypothetical protein